jgi:hypothetical protein
MTRELPPVFYDIRLSTGVPAPFARAVRRAARNHNATVADYIRDALNVALSDEPHVGRDPNFSLLPTVTGGTLKLGGLK